LPPTSWPLRSFTVGIDDLSRYGREECHGHVGFNVEHTGMRVWSHRGAARSPVRLGTELPDTMKRMGRAMAAYRLRFNASREIPLDTTREAHIHIYI
jgi:hypothetical protein